MTNTKHALLITLYQITVKGKKRYIIPSIDALIELLAKRHDKTIGRRWAFECLCYLENEGYITRRQRFTKDPGGGYKQIPSLIAFTLKGAKKLYASGIIAAAALIKEILAWLRGGDKRFPVYGEKPPLTLTEIRKGGIVPLKEVFATLGIAK